jgi:transcription-repair coupling factor (superfamily II helicase)
MDSVGYDMYCKLLSEAVNALRGVTVRESFETAIDVNVDAYIPSPYIRNEQQRLEAYKKISLIRNQADWADVQEELEDRYGGIPRPVQNLLDVALLKGTAHAMGVISVTEKKNAKMPNSFVIAFRGDAAVDVDKLTALIAKEPSRVRFTMTPSPHLTLWHYSDDAMEAVRQAKVLLEGLMPAEAHGG